MATEFGKVRDYAISLAERTLGIEGGRRLHQLELDSTRNDGEIDPFSPVGIEHRKTLAATGRIIGILNQFFAPGVSEVFNRAIPGDHPFLLKTMVAIPVDTLGIVGTMMLSHNLVEAVALKLAINAATHVAIDVGEVAINRMRSLRTPAITLNL